MLIVLLAFALVGCNAANKTGTPTPPTPTPTPSPTLTSIKISSSSTTVSVGANVVFTATALDQNKNTMSGVEFTFSTSLAETVVGTTATSVTYTATTPGTDYITATPGNIGNPSDVTGSATLNIGSLASVTIGYLPTEDCTQSSFYDPFTKSPVPDIQCNFHLSSLSPIQLTLTAYDQYGDALTPQPDWLNPLILPSTWVLGSVVPGGVYCAGNCAPIPGVSITPAGLLSITNAVPVANGPFAVSATISQLSSPTTGSETSNFVVVNILP